MTEALSSPALVAIAGGILATAIVVATWAVVRAASAERRLTTLYAEIETAIGTRIDRSVGDRSSDQISAELKRLTLARPRATGRGESGIDWIAIAVCALDTAAHAVAALERESEAAHTVAALGLSERLAASREAVAGISCAGNPNDALESGTLNDVLTTAPIVAGYFSHDARLAPVIQAYLLAASALRLVLAEAGIVVEIPAVLSIVSGREASGEVMDARELRRIPQARMLANRVADRLAPGENLIVYCSVPGWTTHEGHRPAAVVFWNSASWLI